MNNCKNQSSQKSFKTASKHYFQDINEMNCIHCSTSINSNNVCISVVTPNTNIIHGAFEGNPFFRLDPGISHFDFVLLFSESTKEYHVQLELTYTNGEVKQDYYSNDEPGDLMYIAYASMNEKEDTLFCINNELFHGYYMSIYKNTNYINDNFRKAARIFFSFNKKMKEMLIPC